MSGQLDAMIAALPLDHAALSVERLFEDRFLLAVPAADPDFVSPPVGRRKPSASRTP